MMVDIGTYTWLFREQYYPPASCWRHTLSNQVGFFLRVRWCSMYVCVDCYSPVRFHYIRQVIYSPLVQRTKFIASIGTNRWVHSANFSSARAFDTRVAGAALAPIVARSPSLVLSMDDRKGKYPSSKIHSMYSCTPSTRGNTIILCFNY